MGTKLLEVFLCALYQGNNRSSLFHILYEIKVIQCGANSAVCVLACVTVLLHMSCVMCTGASRLLYWEGRLSARKK